MPTMLEKLFGSKKKEAEREQRERINNFLAKVQADQWTQKLNPEAKTYLDVERSERFGKLLRQGYLIVGESPRNAAIEEQLATEGMVFIERERGNVADRIIRGIMEKSDGAVARDDFHWETGAVYLNPKAREERPNGPYTRSDVLVDIEGVTVLMKLKPKK